MTTVLHTPGTRLLEAQDRALGADQRLDRLFLNPVAAKVPNLPIHESITSARVILTIEGASTVDLDISDPDWLIEQSGILDRGDDGRLDAVDIVLDGIVYRLASASRAEGGADTLTLTFEDRAVALLRARWGAKSASRGSMTRAQFIHSLVREVRSVPIPFYAPEKSARQPVERVDFPDTAPTSRDDSGFDPDARLTVKGAPADGEQRRNIEIALRVADQEDAGPKARLALIVAGIGESNFRRGSKHPGSQAEGVFQLIPSTAAALNLDPRDTEATARHFLRKGYYRYGGAIELARENTGMSVGEIVSKVEGSDAGGGFYQAYADEARAIVEKWNRGDQGDGPDDSPVRIKAYKFTRGEPGNRKENTWEAALRLAEEVSWRFYVAGGVAAFISDDSLMMNRASLVLAGPHDDGLLERPGYDWHHGKLAGEVDLRVNANRYAVPPGAVVACTGPAWGPVNGRWIVHTAEYDLLDATATRLALTKPLPPRKEPAPEPGSGTPRSERDKNRKTTSSGLTYPLADHGTKGGGPADHALRAWGNWQSDNAVDILIKQGVGVYAVDDGTITKLGGAWRGGQGNPDGYNVTLKTDDNEWFYTHLRERDSSLKVGKRVKAGDLLGSSGAANGVEHLHIACKSDDPVRLLGL